MSLKIIHSFNQEVISKKIQPTPEISFLLTNNIGGYLWLGEKPVSSYQGWFFSPNNLVGQKMIKVIEDIHIQDRSPVSVVKNNFWNIERESDLIKEQFFIPRGFNALAYQVVSQKKKTVIELFLDIKESYQNIEWGREYQIYREEELLIIEYHQSGLVESPIFLTIKAENLKIEEAKNWLPRNYSYDVDRRIKDGSRWVFLSLRMIFKSECKVVFSVSTKKKQAIEEVRYVFKNLFTLKEKEKKLVNQEIETFASKIDILGQEKKFASICTFDSLRKMAVLGSNVFWSEKKIVTLKKEKCLSKENEFLNIQQGIFAGLPWFFQFWLRDEAICLKSFYKIDSLLTKRFLLKDLKLIDEQGHVDGSSDGVGWVFKRISDFLEEDVFTKKEREIIKQKIEESVSGLLEYYTKNGFAFSLKQQTWMDSLDRDGGRIEIQSLRLNIYKLAFELTGEIKYLKLEQRLKKRVREKFWNGKFLADGLTILDNGQELSDFTIRPNVFLAAYIYPQLLSKKEWDECFKNVLSRLWLEWGGVATIDKTNFLFQAKYTGQDPQSYHQGDSWFWVNNLTALVLSQFDRKKFRKYVRQILKTSTQEILWQGIIGHHSELSSAQYFRSQGCLAQAWSSALYLELVSHLALMKNL